MIQVAGIRNQTEAELLIAAGVEYLGFPLRLDVHTPDLTEAEAARIIRALPTPHKGVLITYLDQAADIVEFLDFLGTRYLQLHGPITLIELEKLRQFKPDAFLIKSLVVTADNEAELADDVRRLAPLIDAFITDTFDPATGAKGATGKTHDWNISRRLVELSPKPVILAGGIRPSNVREAIRIVRPAGVDVHTGVEDLKGNKDAALVRQFVEIASAELAALATP